MADYTNTMNSWAYVTSSQWFPNKNHGGRVGHVLMPFENLGEGGNGVNTTIISSSISLPIFRGSIGGQYVFGNNTIPVGATDVVIIGYFTQISTSVVIG